MNADVDRDMRRSQSAFIMHVWPAIAPHIGGGRAVSMEASHDKELRTLFDVSSGIDAWQVVDGGGLYGIASRVQPSGHDWSTFTVRKSRKSGAKTEWAKLREAVFGGDGRVYPKWFVQAYTSRDGSQLIACAVVKTAELVSHIEWFCQEEHDTRETMNATFWMVGWDKPARYGGHHLAESSSSLVVFRSATIDR